MSSDSLVSLPRKDMERERLPEWLRRPSGSAAETAELKRMLRGAGLNTVCEEARCPNISECFGRGTATFMILGDVCTRGCRFCSVTTGKPHFSPDDFEKEAESVAEASARLKLRHVVITSVARDDLPDGGAAGFVASIKAVRERLPEASIEVLTPDFRGNEDAIEQVVAAKPTVLNHNLETVPRLYRKVRPGSSYQRSLSFLQYAKSLDAALQTKTGIMLGLGETMSEVLELLRDSRAHGIDIFTAGQYMQPTRNHLPVASYLTPEVFDDYRRLAEEVGFRKVFVGPLVRSSYHADEFVS